MRERKGRREMSCECMFGGFIIEMFLEWSVNGRNL